LQRKNTEDTFACTRGVPNFPVKSSTPSQFNRHWFQSQAIWGCGSPPVTSTGRGVPRSGHSPHLTDRTQAPAERTLQSRTGFLVGGKNHPSHFIPYREMMLLVLKHRNYHRISYLSVSAFALAGHVASSDDSSYLLITVCLKIQFH